MSKALKIAIEANDPDAVRKALKEVKDLNRKIPGANKPLLYAAEKGADRVVEVLFEAGAVAERRSTFPGDTPFAVAARHEQSKVMEQLWALKQVSKHALEHALLNALSDGREAVLEMILKIVKPPITIELFRVGCASNHAPKILKLLIQYGGDVHGRHDTLDAKGMTPLHDLVRKPDVIRTLVENGADVNAQDSLGRTPLMILASRLEGIEASNARNELLKKLKDTGKATVHGSLSIIDGLNAVQTLLELGADATRVDNSGNDAIDYCQFEYQRSKTEPNQNIIETLRKAGAKGSKATLELFDAIWKKNLDAMRAAIKSGADVNRLTPPPVPITPLTCAAGGSPESVEFVRVLLHAGADPNKYDKKDTPLISASRCGNLPAVKELVAAGANIHAIQLNEEFPDNAYSAAPHDKPDVVDYLKSLGASKPKPVKTEPLKPGVESWNDFSELLVKSSVEKAAEALAKMIKGIVQLNVYGQSLLPGKQAFVLVRPKGMDWCNVFQIAPPRLRFEDTKKTETFACELAKVSGVPVLSIEYSDTSDAAGVFRAEPDGKSTRDDGWDRDMLEEMVEAMGDKAPAWARKQLAKTDEDEPSSTEKLEMLAERERFVVAAFGVDCEPGHKVEVDFTGYAAEAFDGVAFVSS